MGLLEVLILNEEEEEDGQKSIASFDAVHSQPFLCWSSDRIHFPIFAIDGNALIRRAHCW